jgi:hypothetical protein
MLLELAPEWSMELDRGPDWIFIGVVDGIGSRAGLDLHPLAPAER